MKDLGKIKIAIKYCGGCNPEFDRMKAMAGMLERLAKTVEVVPLDDERAEILVAVEGCPTACADLSGFKGKKIIVLSSQEAVAGFVPELQSFRTTEPQKIRR
ncbi:MAG: hypothetical protein N2F24_02980 [Deltaproteobacteria bacterium]